MNMFDHPMDAAAIEYRMIHDEKFREYLK